MAQKLSGTKGKVLLKTGGGLTSLMSSSNSAGLQSMSVISPELVVAVKAITEVLPSEG